MTTTFNTEQFTAAAKTVAADANAYASTAFAGFTKLAEYNLATAKAAFAESVEAVDALTSAKAPQDLLAAQAALLKPMAEKAADYGRTVYQIASETSAELSKLTESKVAEGKKAAGAAFEALAKNAPAGSETIVAAFKNAVATGEQVIASAQAAAKNAVAQTEANVTKVSDLAVKAAKSVAKK